MTIEIEILEPQVFNCTGVSDFPVTNFKWDNDADLVVTYIDTGGNETELDFEADYSIDDGVVKWPAVPSTGRLHITRLTPIDQELNLVNGHDFDAGNINGNFDKAIMIMQELLDMFSHCIRTRMTGPRVDNLVPNGGSYLAWNAEGTEIINVSKQITEALVTPFAQALLDDSNGRTALMTLHRWSGIYFADQSELDQGALTLAGDKTIADFITLADGSPCEIHLLNNAGNLSSSYFVETNLEIPYNCKIVPHPGAVFALGEGIDLTIQDGLTSYVCVEWFQTNDVPGTTDVSSGFQTAVNCCRATILAGMKAPPIKLKNTKYKITASINCTFSSPIESSVSFVGQGRNTTEISAILTEAYPAIDFTGNSGGGIKGLRISALSGSATACVLCASPSGAFSAGNNVNIEDALLSLNYAGVGVALVIYNSDLPNIKNVECRGPGGATFGFGKPALVTSKFQTLHVADSTTGRFDNCIFLGNSAPGFEYTGGAQVQLNTVYSALVEGGAGTYAVKVSSPSGDSGNSLYAYNLRTENQSSNGSTVSVGFIASGSQGGHIDGSLNNEIMIHVAASKIINRYDLNITEAVNTNPLFSGAGGVAECVIKTNATQLGSIGSNSGNIFVGELSHTEAIPNNERNLVLKDNVWFENRNPILFPPGQRSTFLRPNSSFGLKQFNPEYTGGSGEQLIGTMLIPANILTQPEGAAPLVNVGIKIIGETSGSNSGGRLRLLLDDGSNTQEIMDHTSIPPGAGGIEINITIMNVSIDSMRVSVLSTINGSTLSKYTNMHGSPISVTGNIDLKIYETNSGTWGLIPLQAIGQLL